MSQQELQRHLKISIHAPTRGAMSAISFRAHKRLFQSTHLHEVRLQHSLRLWMTS